MTRPLKCFRVKFIIRIDYNPNMEWATITDLVRTTIQTFDVHEAQVRRTDRKILIRYHELAHNMNHALRRILPVAEAVASTFRINAPMLSYAFKDVNVARALGDDCNRQLKAIQEEQ